MAIGKTEVIPLLLEACPDFRAAWEAYSSWWGGQARGDYNDIGEFARFLVESLRQGQTSCFSAVFQVVERLLAEGDEEVKSLMIIGLLEDLGNLASHEPFGADAFLQWLGPLATDAWTQLSETWHGKSSLIDIIRDEIRKGKGNAGA